MLLVSLTFAFGCSGSMSGGRKETRFIYSYALIKPAVNDQLLFKDDYITIQFKLDESAVKFQLQNISEVPISIVWENVAIGLNNRVYPVKNSATLYQTEMAHPVSLIIPSLGYVRDLVIPRDYISIENSEWVERDLFPSNDKGSPKRKNLILKYIGSQIKLLLPLKIGEVVQDYTFIFKVKNVDAVPEDKLPPIKERPVPPQVASAVQGSQSLLPVLIAGGILAVAIYAFSREKAAPINF